MWFSGKRRRGGGGGVSLCYVIWEGKGGAIFGVVRAVALIALVKMDGGFEGWDVDRWIIKEEGCLAGLGHEGF